MRARYTVVVVVVVLVSFLSFWLVTSRFLDFDTRDLAPCLRYVFMLCEGESKPLVTHAASQEFALHEEYSEEVCVGFFFRPLFFSLLSPLSRKCVPLLSLWMNHQVVKKDH